MSQKPSVGRIVHYHPYGTEAFSSLSLRQVAAREPFAAIVTAVSSDIHVELTVFRPGSAPEPTHGSVPYGTEPGCWSWPERV